MNSTLPKSWPGDIAALLAGLLLTLSFAPFNIFPLAILCPAILLFSFLPVSPKRAFLRGGLFGLGWFGSGLYWIFISIHQFGNVPVSLSLLILALFILILSLFPACHGYLFQRFFSGPAYRKLYAFAALWVLLEWVRSWLFTGFPWLLLGDTQVFTPLKGYAPLFSVYGVSLAVCLSSVLLVHGFLLLRERKKYFICLLIFLFIWGIGALLSLIHWTKPIGESLSISLVQGNIPQELKWDPEQNQTTLETYVTLSKNHWNSKAVIWPETAIPIEMREATPFLEKVTAEALRHHSTLITGIPIKAGSHAYYNAVLALGVGKGSYIKQHLVPFGEFTPLRPYLNKLLSFFQIPMSELIPGPSKAKPIVLNSLKIATFICYEIAFPEAVLQYDPASFNVLLTVTDDAWFGRSIAQAQHLAIARMRALEVGRPIMFASNNGITAFISSNGQIDSSAPSYESIVLTGQVQAMQGSTPWQSFGLDPLLLCLIIILFFSRVKNHGHPIST